MATITEIRNALASTIEDGLEAEVFAYARVQDVLNLPAIVVIPGKADFTGAFQRGTDEWQFDVFILVSRSDTDTGQERLDDFVTGGGPDSIREAVYNTPGLGLASFCDAFVRGMSAYGGEWDVARVNHVGAILKVVVRTDGSS